jgi:hypothetical protein
VALAGNGLKGCDLSDHDSPISLQGGGTLAKQLVAAEDGGHWPVPEGTILASGVSRVAAFSVDVASGASPNMDRVAEASQKGIEVHPSVLASMAETFDAQFLSISKDWRCCDELH